MEFDKPNNCQSIMTVVRLIYYVFRTAELLYTLN